MARAGAAWRGWFPLGGELTSGRTAAGGPVLRRGARRHGRRVRAGRPCTAPERPARTFHGAGAGVDGRDDFAGPRRHAGRGDGARPAAGVVRGRADPRTDRAVPHLPLPTLPDANSWGWASTLDGLLTILARTAPAGSRSAPWRLDRRPRPARCAGVQHRRHARPHDRRPLPVHSPPRPQHQRSGPPVVPLLLRSGWDALGGAPCRRGTGRRASRTVGRLGVHRWEGTYGDYLLGKVSKVFPSWRPGDRGF